MRDRIAYSSGSILLLFGAFAVGGTIHAVVVEGSLAPTSLLAVAGIVVGVALILGGGAMERRFQDEILPDEDEEEDEGEEEFDEEMAPFDESDLEKYERDEPDS